ncbi:MAG: hypothetical protein GY772_02130 [bacterium]|nr:hypothetical protein [bacterium]
MSPSAHPSHWVAAREEKADAYVLKRRWSEHSRAHGEELGRRLRHAELEAETPPAPGAPPKLDFHAVSCPAPEGGQIVEAQEVTQGPKWNEGLNKLLPAGKVTELSTRLVAEQLERHMLTLTNVCGQSGRGLITQVMRREGDTICPASALFFDGLPSLTAFLEPREAAAFRDRVARIPGVNFDGVPRDVLAVLVGAVQYVNHYENIRPRHNCVLHFDASRGFNEGSLVIKAYTRNGCGIAGGSQILLNYGVTYDLARAPHTPSPRSMYSIVLVSRSRREVE